MTRDALLTQLGLVATSCRLVKHIGQELRGRRPAEGSHREVVGAAIVDSELLGEVVQ